MSYRSGQAPRLRDLTWREFGELIPSRYDAAVVPVGTIEAHGGIPLGTDIIIPEFLTEKLAEKLDLVIAPAVNYGVTRTLLPYPGSHTVSSTTFEKYCTEVFVDLGRIGFKKLVVVNGHGGHITELKNAALAAFRERSLFTVVLHWWLMVPDAGAGIYDGVGHHGAAEETAGVLAADAGLVDEKDLVGLKGATYAEGVYYMPFPRPVGVRETGKGMPSADVEKARRYMDRVVEKCVSIVDAAFSGWREELGR